MTPFRHIFGPAPLEGAASVADWFAKHRDFAKTHDRTIDRAIAGAARADRVAWAFVSGFSEAVHALWPSAPADELTAFAVSERGGNAPRAIATSLVRDGEHLFIRGEKSFVTMGDAASVLLVAARDGDHPDGRPRVRVARVPTNAPGVSMTKVADLPMLPEVPHVRARLDVAIEDDDVLEGDGYADYVRKFRTIEDEHVYAAIVAHLAAVGARAAWPHAAVERALSILSSLRSIASEDASDPAVHVALAGVIAHGREWIASIEAYVDALEPSTRERWLRDRPLLLVAEPARTARIESAWKRLTPHDE